MHDGEYGYAIIAEVRGGGWYRLSNGPGVSVRKASFRLFRTAAERKRDAGVAVIKSAGTANKDYDSDGTVDLQLVDADKLVDPELQLDEWSDSDE